MYNFIDIDIILKPGVIASVEVEFEISSHGYRGGYDDPGQPNEYEITRLGINNVMCLSRRSGNRSEEHTSELQSH